MFFQSEIPPKNIQRPNSTTGKQTYQAIPDAPNGSGIFTQTCIINLSYSPRKLTAGTRKSAFEKETHLNQTSILGFQPLVFEGGIGAHLAAFLSPFPDGRKGAPDYPSVSSWSPLRSLAGQCFLEGLS